MRRPSDLGMLDQPADPGRRDIQHPRRAADRSGQHDGADDLDLAQSQLMHRRKTPCRRAALVCPAIRPILGHAPLPVHHLDLTGETLGAGRVARSPQSHHPLLGLAGHGVNWSRPSIFRRIGTGRRVRARSRSISEPTARRSRTTELPPHELYFSVSVAKRLSKRASDKLLIVTQQDIAQLLQCSEGIIAKLESGRRPPKIGEMAALAQNVGFLPLDLPDQREQRWRFGGTSGQAYCERRHGCPYVARGTTAEKLIRYDTLLQNGKMQ